MSAEDPLQKNIRKTTGIHALRKIRAIVDREDAEERTKARALRWLLCYGWLVLLLVGLLLARLLGVI